MYVSSRVCLCYVLSLERTHFCVGFRHTISCSSAEILQAMDGHLATDYLWTTAPDTKTVYGKVSRSKTSARPDQMLLVADQNV